MAGPYRNPVPTVDTIIEIDSVAEEKSIVLIFRKNPPLGWALPGGFVDYGETLEAAAVREAREETSMDVSLTRQFHTYSDPSRDPRQHTISTVFIGKAAGKPVPADDAAGAEIFPLDSLPENIVFDHASILDDYRRGKY